ncbi:hypothetical protein C8R45DRAFT_753834, partial [Mycena sanguinolenta]
TPQDALKWLVNNQKEWLLLIDNADDPEINFTKFLPKCNHGNIIITTRNPSLRVLGEHCKVGNIEESDAVALLLNSAGQEDSAPNKLLAQEIIKVLGHLPLAIVQAGELISESGSLQSYLELFAKNCTELLRKKPAQSHDEYALAVYKTWEISFNKLSQPAAMFLQHCSFMDHSGIPEEIFINAAHDLIKFPEQCQSKQSRLQKLKSGFTRVSPKDDTTNPVQFLSHFLGPTGEWDSWQFWKFISELTACSLISFDPERRLFSIHPMVHRWIRTTMADQ